jgi:2-oxoisovalerate dehydrogenase E2 component (dihydrolipoyl transacylase)
VLRLADEHQLDLALVRGTGIEGRVTRQDVTRYIENPALHTVAPSSSEGVVGANVGRPSSPAAPASVGLPPPAVGAVGNTKTPLSPTRRTIAARMLESHHTIPVAWMAVEADVTGLVALRDRVKDDFQRAEGAKLSYMPFFVQAIVGALKQHPAVNATFNDDAITLHARQHIGIAVATDHGLLVPVVRDAGDRSIAGLAREIDALVAKARERKLAIEAMRGATMTVDNTGAFGSVLSQPIIPVGQVAIITTEAIRRELRPIGEGFGARSVMNLCISIDHRALDGAQAGAFMADVRRRLEDYSAEQAVY